MTLINLLRLHTLLLCLKSALAAGDAESVAGIRQDIMAVMRESL